MSPDITAGRLRNEETPQKPQIVVHGSSVDFGDVRFDVYVGSDYSYSSINVINAEKKGLTDEQQDEIINAAMPWIEKVLDYEPLGAWGEARFRSTGMELIDEVRETYYWTFPTGGSFRPGIPLPESWNYGGTGQSPRIPREYTGISLHEGNLDEINPFELD